MNKNLHNVADLERIAELEAEVERLRGLLARQELDDGGRESGVPTETKTRGLVTPGDLAADPAARKEREDG